MVRLSCTAASRSCPRFGNNDHVTAEITKHQMCTSHGTCLILDYCGQHTCMSVTRKDLAAAAPGCPGAPSWLCPMRLCYDSAMAALWLCRGCCCGWCNSLYRDCVMAAVPTRREEIYLQFWRLLTSSSSLLARALPTMGSANGVHSEIQQDSWRCDQDQQYTFSVSVFTYNVRIPIATLGHD